MGFTSIDELIRIPPAEKRALRAAAKADGKCINCLTRPATVGPRGGLNYCDFCREKFKAVKAREFDRNRDERIEQMTIRAQSLKDKHLCMDCKQPVTMRPNGSYPINCEACSKLRNARKPSYSHSKIHENRRKAMEMYGNSCQDCGHTDLRVLEFHHTKVDANLEHPRVGMRTHAMIARILRDGYDPSIALVCSNCHRLRHIQLGIEHTIIPS